MRINGEKVFRFNPFTIMEWTEAEVIAQYTWLEESLTYGDEPSALADDIDTFANMNYLIGEMTARYYKIVADFEAELKVNTANAVYRERNNWMKINTDKTPAMAYFEAKAQSMYLDEYKQLSDYESRLKRFKIAYDSIDSKQNALKKKMDAIRFDQLNR